MRLAVLVGNRLHIGHSRGCGAHAKAAMAGGQHSGVVVATHDAEGDEGGIQRHHNGLRGQNHHQRARQPGQLPQLERQQRNCQVNR